MKNRFLTRILAATSLLLLLWPIGVAHAASGSIYLSSYSDSVTDGGSLVVAVYMNGGGNPINGVSVNLNYPASKLQYVGVNFNGSVFEVGAAAGGGGGGVNISRGTLTPVSGTGLVGTVTFKGLSSSGTATIGISGSSSLVSAKNSQAVPFTSSGVTLRMTSYTAPAVSPAAPAAPAAPKDATPPVISAVKATAVTPFGATITWTTNEAANSEVDYGLDSSYGLSTSLATRATKHSLKLNSSLLQPELLLHYRIKSADAAGNVRVSKDYTLELPGVPVTVVVRGANGQPQAGAKVTLGAATATTDDKGQATLPAGLGDQKVIVSYEGVTVERNITVNRSDKPRPPVQLSLAHKPYDPWIFVSIGLAVLLVFFIGLDVLRYGARRLAPLTFLLNRRREKEVAPEEVIDDSAASPHGNEPEPEPVRDPLADLPEEPVPAPAPVPAPPVPAAHSELPKPEPLLPSAPRPIAVREAADDAPADFPKLKPLKKPSKPAAKKAKHA